MLVSVVAALQSMPVMADTPNPVAADPVWTLTEHDQGQAVELSRRSAGGSLAAVCSNGQCNLFVEPRSACMPRMKYPVLLNSARQMGVLTGVCRVLADESGPRLIVHLNQRDALLAAMVRGDDLTLAFPAGGGTVDIIDVDMDGVLPLLKQAMARRTGQPNPGHAGDLETLPAARPDVVDTVVRRSRTRYQL